MVAFFFQKLFLWRDSSPQQPRKQTVQWLAFRRVYFDSNHLTKQFRCLNLTKQLCSKNTSKQQLKMTEKRNGEKNPQLKTQQSVKILEKDWVKVLWPLCTCNFLMGTLCSFYGQSKKLMSHVTWVQTNRKQQAKNVT